jgi:hypothetical protein
MLSSGAPVISETFLICPLSLTSKGNAGSLIPRYNQVTAGHQHSSKGIEHGTIESRGIMMKGKLNIALVAVIGLSSWTPDAFAAKSPETGHEPATTTLPAPALVTEERSATATEDKKTVAKIEKIKEKVEGGKKEPLAYRTILLLHNVLSQP